MSISDSVLGFTNSYIQSLQSGLVEQMEQVVKKHGNGQNIEDVRTKSDTDTSKVNLPKPGKSSIAMMLSVLAKMKEIVDDSKEATKAELEQKRSELKAVMENRIRENNKMQEKRIEQAKEAQEQKEKAEKGGVFGKIFGFISAAASIIGGAFMCLSNPAAGMLMIAGGCCEIAAQVCTMCGKHEAAEILGLVAMGLVGASLLCYGIPIMVAKAAPNAAKAAGQVGTKVAEKTGMQAISKGVQKAAQNVFNKLSGNVAKKAGTEAVEQGAKEGTKQGSKLLGRLNMMASVLSSSASIYRGALMIDQGVNQLRANELEFEIQELLADLAKNQALLNQIEALIERLLEYMNAQVENLSSATSIVSQILDDQVKASQSVLAGNVAAAI